LSEITHVLSLRGWWHMNRDPFYLDIIRRLDGTLDPELFERCAADLLRSIWPGLTPIRGGSDSGMDGAVGDGRGEPFPLISTTSKDVIGNLTKNLKTYVREVGVRDRAVLATSRPLTTKKRSNLSKRARELGFLLLQIYDQSAFADLLYRSPPWCLELLNLPSDPRPLSKIPVTAHPFFDAPLIGRDASLNWLSQTSGDRLLLGQPGAGKTFLLHQMAQENRGLFLVSRERGDIAAGIRSQEPSAIFVDDAAPDPSLLPTLQHMRTEMGVDFAIVATGWPGHEVALVQALNLPEQRIHRLEALTRDEIVQVINSMGVTSPNQLVHEIVDQAEGRPGLAVTLALLWLQGGRREVVFGDALRDSVVNFAEQFIAAEAAQILAVLAVSGDAGLSLPTVEELTGLRLLEVHRVLNQLTSSGVIMDMGEGRLTVRPPALRYALVRNVFFRGVPLPIAPILARVPSRSEAARVLIGARERGGIIPDDLLRPLVIESQSTEVWEAYAGLGREEAEWVLRDRPDMLAVIVESGLYNAPETFLPELLTAAVDDRRSLNQHPDHPLRVIESWIESALPGRGRAFLRRRILLDSTETWLSENGDWRVGGHALRFILSPNFEYRALDPGQGRYVEFGSGVLLPYELSQIQGLWPRVFSLISGIHITDWPPIQRMIEPWIYGKRIRLDLPVEVIDILNAFAGQMLREVVSLARQHPGMLHWASRIVHRLGADIPIELDADFETLYPSRDHEQKFREAGNLERVAVGALASCWSREAPEQIAGKIAQIEAEANSAGLSWPRWTPLLCNVIAAQVTSRVLWARHFLNAKLTSDLVIPFLRLGAETSEENWESLALECLAMPGMRSAVIDLALTLPQAPPELFELALESLNDSPEHVKWACAKGSIPEHHLRLLLRHPEVSIASAAAEGEWKAEPQGTVRESLREDWEEAFARSSSEYWLTEVLRKIPDLASRWLQNHLADEEFDTYDPAYGEAIQSAVSALTLDERRNLLEKIPDRSGFGMLVASLVSGYPQLYRQLLQNKRLRRYHSAPLAGTPDGEWIEKAILACEAGYSHEDIAREAFFGHQGGNVWASPWSARCSEWIECFERLCVHSDDRIRGIGEAGRAWAIKERANAQRMERREAVYGRMR
jgi:hypothetical protein